MDGSEGRGILDAPFYGPEAEAHAQPAHEWLIAESRARPFHLIAIGPLTNIAAALAQDPGFMDRLRGITAMGGLLNLDAMPAAWRCAVAERGMAAWPDYNTMTDAAAALAVAKAGTPITWVTLDATIRAPLRMSSRGQLPADRPLGAALGRAIDAWQATWFPAMLPASYDRAPVPEDAVAMLHDPLAVASVFTGVDNGIRGRQTHLTYKGGSVPAP
jgi:inosine-uridine nucleoside N-ribohydrolase